MTRILKKIFKFEEVNFDYIESQLKGIEIELNREYQHDAYIKEKVENVRGFFNSVMENFGKRIMYKELREEFKKLLEGKND